MRIFAVSDLHVDYDDNARWVAGLSTREFQDDLLILAGDVSDSLALLDNCLRTLARRFRQVLFVPGNHDLWVKRHDPGLTSFDKFEAVRRTARDCGVSMAPFHHGSVSILPMMSWYDYSFGLPSSDLLRMWADFRACRWPNGYGTAEIADHFLAMNETLGPAGANQTLITFSHFLPRIDVMPHFIPPSARMLYPVLGSRRLEAQVRRLQPAVHVYGHSHVNRKVRLDGTLYVNNAFAYPQETRIAAKVLLCVHEAP